MSKPPKPLKLPIELVPSTAWGNNVRAMLSKSQWQIIRQQVCNQAYGSCQICGATRVKDHLLECHEVWHYDDDQKIQKLIGMQALCPGCHDVKHFGLSEVQGKSAQTIKHFQVVNDLPDSKARKYVQQMFKQWEERSQKQWDLDVSFLSTYGIDVSKIKVKR